MKNQAKMDDNAALLLEAFKRHSANPDWYAAQLANAMTHTQDIAEAIAIADIMNEENPTPPTTTDEEERSAQKELGEALSNLR